LRRGHALKIYAILGVSSGAAGFGVSGGGPSPGSRRHRPA
jgi:hypothetical protein